MTLVITLHPGLSEVLKEKQENSSEKYKKKKSGVITIWWKQSLEIQPFLLSGHKHAPPITPFCNNCEFIFRHGFVQDFIFHKTSSDSFLLEPIAYS